MARSEGGAAAAHLRDVIDKEDVPDYILSKMKLMFHQYRDEPVPQADNSSDATPTSSDGDAVEATPSTSSIDDTTDGAFTGAEYGNSSGWFTQAAADALQHQADYCHGPNSQQQEPKLSTRWQALQKAAAHSVAAAEAAATSHLPTSPHVPTTRVQHTTGVFRSTPLTAGQSPRPARVNFSSSTACRSQSPPECNCSHTSAHSPRLHRTGLAATAGHLHTGCSPNACHLHASSSPTGRPGSAGSPTAAVTTWHRPSTAPGHLSTTRTAAAGLGQHTSTLLSSTLGSNPALAGVPREATRMMRQYHEQSLVARGPRCKAAGDRGVQQQEWQQMEQLLLQLDQVYQLQQHTKLQQQAAAHQKQLAAMRRQVTSTQCVPQVLASSKVAHLQAQLAAARKALARRDRQQDEAVVKMAEHSYRMASLLDAAAAEREQLDVQLQLQQEKEAGLRQQLQSSFLQGVAWQAADTVPHLASLSSQLAAAGSAFQQQLHEVVYNGSWEDLGEVGEVLQEMAAELVTTVQQAAAQCMGHVDEARMVGTLLQQQQQPSQR